MKDLYDDWIKRATAQKAGNFVTIDGRVVFIGGPSSGGGSASSALNEDAILDYLDRLTDGIPEKYFDNPEDNVLKYIVERLGYDGLPKQLSDAEFSETIQVFRGVVSTDSVSADEMVDRYKNGEMFVGKGIYGNGVYVSEEKEKAMEYAKDSSGRIIEIGIDPQANVIHIDALEDFTFSLARSANERLSAAKDRLQSVRNSHGTQSQEYNNVLNEYNRSQKLFDRLNFLDSGAVAALMGYDAIVVPHRKFYVILNRTKTGVRNAIQ